MDESILKRPIPKFLHVAPKMNKSSCRTKNSRRQFAELGGAEIFGLPERAGIKYSLAICMICQGILSGVYHVCPNATYFQFGNLNLKSLKALKAFRVYFLINFLVLRQIEIHQILQIQIQILQKVFNTPDTFYHFLFFRHQFHVSSCSLINVGPLWSPAYGRSSAFDFFCFCCRGLFFCDRIGGSRQPLVLGRVFVG
jgi:hypothetical protein